MSTDIIELSPGAAALTVLLCDAVCPVDSGGGAVLPDVSLAFARWRKTVTPTIAAATMSAPPSKSGPLLRDLACAGGIGEAATRSVVDRFDCADAAAIAAILLTVD